MSSESEKRKSVKQGYSPHPNRTWAEFFVSEEFCWAMAGLVFVSATTLLYFYVRNCLSNFVAIVGAKWNEIQYGHHDPTADLTQTEPTAVFDDSKKSHHTAVNNTDSIIFEPDVNKPTINTSAAAGHTVDAQVSEDFESNHKRMHIQSI